MASNDKPSFLLSTYPAVYLPAVPLRTYVYEPAILPNLYSSEVIVNGYDRAIQYRKYLDFLEAEKFYNQRLKEKVDDQIYKYEAQRQVEKELDRKYRELEIRKSLLDLYSSSCCYSCRAKTAPIHFSKVVVVVLIIIAVIQFINAVSIRMCKNIS